MKELLFFTGSHCAVCPGIKSTLYARLDSDHIKDVAVKEISVDELEGARLAASLSIFGLPAFVYKVDGVIQKTFVGSSAVKSLIDEGII